jgi:hypothetical protein
MPDEVELTTSEFSLGTDKKASANNLTDVGPTVPKIGIDPVPPPSEDVLGVRNAPRYTAAEVQEAIGEAEKALATWTSATVTADDAKKKEAALALYQALARLAERVTFADPKDAENTIKVRGPVQAMLAAWAEDAAIMTVLADGGGWLDRAPAERRTDGVVLVGTVKAIMPLGKVFGTRMVLADAKNTEVTVISVVDPKDHFQPTNRLIVLGVLIADPTKAIGGYEGEESRVVFGGLPWQLPAR